MKTISLIKRTGNIGGHAFSLTLALIGLFLATFALRADVLAQVNPSWIPTGSLNTPRQHPTATLLPNGKVLVVGGGWFGNELNSAELYDPSTGTWSFTGNLNTPCFVPTSTLLPNGKVLVVGGLPYGDSAELYDPSSGTWSVTGSLNIGRYLHTATLLQNGKVLVAGGTGGDNRAELYDPATGTWSVTGGLLTDRYGQTATLLQNGQVLVAGGWDDNDVIPTPLASAELYDPVTGTWSVTGNLNASRIAHTATLLPDGRVLIAAGYTDNWVPSHGGFAVSPTSLNSAELYDPATGTWSVTASLNTRLSGHTATLLPNGKVLVAGGSYWTIDGNTPNDGTYPCGDTLSCSPKYLNAAELYDVATGTWSVTASLNTARSGHTATLLVNGNVLVAGGCNFAGFSCNGLNSAELYNSHPNIIAAFVRQQYLDFLDREPDAGEVSAWVSALDRWSKADLIEVFMDSEEFRFEGKFIAQTYLGILTRDADYAGFRGWLGALLVGVSREQIVQAFLDSGEFQSRFGSNLTNGQFVERMYNNILLRSSDPGGFNAWVGALNNGQLTKAQMALSFLDSGEFQGLFVSQNRVDISLLYFDMLQRDPDAGGFSNWVGVLSSGVPLTAVIDGFLNSPEYQAGF